MQKASAPSGELRGQEVISHKILLKAPTSNASQTDSEFLYYAKGIFARHSLSAFLLVDAASKPSPLNNLMTAAESVGASGRQAMRMCPMSQS